MRFSDGRNEVSDVVGISNCHLAEWLLCVQVFVLISDVMCNNISIRTSHPPIRWRPGNFLGRHLYTRGVGMSRS